MAHRLNLARRPFVDTRPANLTASVLLLAAVVLSVISMRTVVRYLDDSKRTREAIASLRTEIDALEEKRRSAEGRLARYDVEGLSVSAEDANQVALRRSFSWTRFLSRLEQTLPADVRVTTVRLAPLPRAKADAPRSGPAFGVELGLITRDPLGLPKTVRAFYQSKWFDRPSPRSEEIGDRRPADGRRLQIGVIYQDVPEEGR
jgi:Tfp pilus assembly protein PilN